VRRGDNKGVNTLRLTVDPNHLETREADAAIDRAAQILRAGGLVALPTETVYGLGANALDREAVARIFVAKSRPAWDPIIVHVAGIDMLGGVVAGISDAAHELMAAFWPGPLTLLLPKADSVPEVVTAGRPLVGVRMPSHPVALALIRRAEVPVAAPSANRFGHISPTTATHVLHDLDGRIDAVLDAGPADRGVESTVLDPSQSPMIIYRPGAVTVEQIREVAGAAEIFKGGVVPDESPKEGLPSPGVGIRHYAPKARLVLIEAAFGELAARLADADHEIRGERMGVMLPNDVDGPLGIPFDRIFAWGKWDAPDELAQRLYAGLRALDAAGCSVILCPVPPAGGLGEAIRDRLQKAGKGRDR
jgi:L-threonylcarbamoyladenylate synthase